MWLKTCGSLVVLLLLSVDLSTGQTMSSTDWEFQQVLNSMIERENRVIALITKILPQLNATITDLKANGALTLTVNALISVRDFIMALSTTTNYAGWNTTVSCTDMALIIGNINYDIQKAWKIKIDVDVNGTLLFVQIANLNVAFVTNYLYMTDAQRQSVQSVVTQLTLLFDEYNTYDLTLAAAIYKYVRLYIELLFCKKTFCSCPVALSANSTAALATVDSGIKDIIATVDPHEVNIRNMSTDIIAKIAAINPNLKLNSLFIFITTTLDTISTLMKGYQLLTTNAIINASVTCDDAAMKVAFIEYQLELYWQNNIEAAKNATFVLYQLNALNTFYLANYYSLTDAQRQGIQGVITAMTNLAVEFGQYILSVVVAWVRLFILLLDSKFARGASCNCTMISNVTTTTTIAATTSEFYF